MKTSSHTFVACGVLMICLFVGTATAQETPRLEIAGSYRFLQPVCPGVDCYNYPGGWQASVATRLTGWFSLVGEVGENVKTISSYMAGPIPLSSTTSGTLIIRSDTRLAIYDVLGGPRATKQFAHVRVFGELLFGVRRNSFADSSTMSIPEEHAQIGTSFSSANTAWAWQPGIGLDVAVARRWATRFGVGYRVPGAAPTSVSHGHVLVTTGIVFRPGRIAGDKDRS
jgi:hypothetical protein